MIAEATQTCLPLSLSHTQAHTQLPSIKSHLLKMVDALYITENVGLYKIRKSQFQSCAVLLHDIATMDDGIISIKDF